MRLLFILGGAAVVVVLLRLRKQSNDAVALAELQALSSPPYRTDKKVTAPTPMTTEEKIRAGFNGINTAGCSLAAGKVGAGGYSQAGCEAFLKYATPIGWAQTGYDVVKAPVKKVATSVYSNTLGRIF